MRKYSKGSVVKDRGEWKAVLSYQENGEQRRVTKRTGIKCFPSKDDTRGKAKALTVLSTWRDELIAEEAQRSDIITCDVPLVEFCTRYAASKMGLVKDSTYLGYVTEIRRLGISPLGKTPIGEITPEMVLKHESALAAKGLSGNSMKHHHAFLSAVFKEAVINRKIDSSPFTYLKSPKAHTRPINSLTVEGRRRLLGLLIPLVPDELPVAAIIALMTGMRRGEVCALRWVDVDFESNTIFVNHSFSKTINGGFQLTSPKDPGGGDSKRAVPFGEGLSNILLQRRAAMAEGRRTLSLGWDPSLYVVGNAYTGKPYSPDLITRDWKCFARTNKVVGSQATEPVFHDLRHTFATLAIREKAIDIKSLAAILGHKDVAMTLNVYADALDEAKRSAMSRIEELAGF